MEKERNTLFLWLLLAILITQNLMIPVMSREFQDQKHYYSPEPHHHGTPKAPASRQKAPSHGFSPPVGTGNCGTPPYGGGGGYNPPPSIPLIPSPSSGGGGGYNPTPTPPSPTSGGYYPTPSTLTPPTPTIGGEGGYNPSPPSPTIGGGGAYNPSPPTPTIGGEGGYNPTPPSPTIGGEGGYNPAPSTLTPPSPTIGGGGGYNPTPSTPEIINPPSSPYFLPGTPTVPTTPPTPFIPIDPGTCYWWITHPNVIWGLLGLWGTVGGVFGVATTQALGTNMSLLEALANTRTDGIGALYREGTASFLNSLSNRAFPFTTRQVKNSFAAALVSNRAAKMQADLFRQANEGRFKPKA